MRKSVLGAAFIVGVVALGVAGGSALQSMAADAPPEAGSSDSNILILRSTSAIYQGDIGGRTGATQKCLAEFANTHFVHKGEIEMAFANGRGVIWLTSETDATWVDSRLLGQNCSGNDPGKIWQSVQGLGSMALPKGSGLATGPCTEAHPILCGTSKGN